MDNYTGCKTFSATTSGGRETLGEKATKWIEAHPELEVVGASAIQSSDNAFHCITIVVFFKERS